MLGPYKAQRPVATLRDANARCDSNLELGPFAPATDTQRAPIEPRSVEIAGNGKRLRQFPRTVRQSNGRTMPVAPVRHLLDSAQGLECADQNAARRSFAVSYHVQAFMHAVDEVNVGPSGRPEYHLGAWSKAAGGVSGEIVSPEICLGFHQHARRFTVQQDTTDQIGCQFLRGPGKKIQLYGFRSAQ